MYVISIKPDKQYTQKEYTFKSELDVQMFLESLNNVQLESVIEITKYNKKSFKNVYYEFFN